ncbi:MAG: hypothetical protein IKT67_04780 [Lachnospiraceae bacterium]|nr:hypothetical protein [Lachnospiraceae bacterium]
MKLHYISFYATDNVNRQVVRSSISKIEYMMDALKMIDDSLSVVSTALVEEGKGYQKTLKHGNITYLPGIGLKGRIGRRISLLVTQFMLLMHLLTKASSKDIVIFYHSISYFWPLRIAQRIKRFCTIMEFNDKYSYHMNDANKARKIDKIEKRMIQKASAYIFASSMMKELVDESKPFVINYGSYAPALKQNNISDNNSPKCIHLLYSGVLEPLRRAGEMAIDAMKYLPDNYILHIAGFGSVEYLSLINNKIEEVNAQKKCKVIYNHGFLNSSELGCLMQQCDIALSTHAYEFEWQSRLSFPSKIPLNMANDLYIVAANLPVIVNSPFASGCCFYKEHDPKAIAQAINKCVSIHLRGDTMKPSRIISKLDKEFREELKVMVTEKVKKKEK